MLTKIKIDVDDNNQPILRITLPKESDDVRDTLANNLFGKLQYSSCWLRVEFQDITRGDEFRYKTDIVLKPVEPKNLMDEQKEMYNLAVGYENHKNA